MDYSDELQRLLSNDYKKIVARYFSADSDEQAGFEIGFVALIALPRPVLEQIITLRNNKIRVARQLITEINSKLLQAYSSSFQLINIPTYREFQDYLDNRSYKYDPEKNPQPVQISPENRDAKSFESYRSWIFKEYPDTKPLRKAFFLKKFPTFIPTYWRERHTFLVGASGSGKSEAIKLLCLASKQASVKEKTSGYYLTKRDAGLLVIDPHGDLALELARQQCFYADFLANPDNPDLIYIDPALAIDSAKYPTINPFECSGKTFHEAETRARQLMRVFQSLIGGNDGFSPNMEALLWPCLTVLMRKPGATLFDFLRFMKDENQDLLELGKQSQNVAHRLFFENDFMSGRYNTTKGALSSKIQTLLNSSVFAKFIASPKSTINLEAALNEGKSIIVNCAKGYVGEDIAKAVGLFVVGVTMGIAFERAKLPKAERVPIWCFIDEAQNYVSKEVQTILAETRKYGLHMTLATQVVGQDMTRNFENILLGNTAVKIVGATNDTSRRRMAADMGVDEAEFLKLDTGEFIIKVGKKRDAIRLKMSSAFVGNKNAMTWEEWASLKSWRVAHYYRKQTLAVEREATISHSELLELNNEHQEDHTDEPLQEDQRKFPHQHETVEGWDFN